MTSFTSAQPVDQNRSRTEEDKSKEPKNPIEEIFDNVFRVGFGRWVISMVVLGLAAGIISRRPVGGLRAAAIYNLTVGCIHFFLPGPWTRPRAATDPRPPVWYYVILALSTVAWVSAFPLIFAYSNPDDDTYVVFDVSPGDEDRRRGLFGVALSVSQTTLAALEDISLSCGTMGVCCFIFCLYLWHAIYKLSTSKWTPEELAEAWAIWEGKRAAREHRKEQSQNEKASEQAQETAV